MYSIDTDTNAHVRSIRSFNASPSISFISLPAQLRLLELLMLLILTLRMSMTVTRLLVFMLVSVLVDSNKIANTDSDTNMMDD